MDLIEKLIAKNGLVFAFLFVGVIMAISYWLSLKLTRKKIPGAAIAITAGLALAYLGDKKGLADIPLFAGMALLGGSMMRDFAIVATAMGASFEEIKKAGLAGILSLLTGITITFFTGALIAFAMGYTDVKSMTTIGAGACTYIVGPVTGSAIGASSEVIAISIATGVVKNNRYYDRNATGCRSDRARQSAFRDGVWRFDWNYQRCGRRTGGDRSQVGALWCINCDLLYRDRVCCCALQCFIFC